MPYKDKADKLAYQRAYQNAWKQKRRQAWFDENGPCACGSTVDLELHHKDPTQKVDHKIWSWREDRRLKELAKCVVKCNKCHHNIHDEEKRKTVMHGTHSGYSYYGCRCPDCKKAHSISTSAWMREKKHKMKESALIV